MSLRSRKQTIRNLVSQVRVLITKGGTPTEFEVPGSKPHTMYHVCIYRNILKKTLCDGTPYYEYRCSCHDKSSPSQLPPCPGNSYAIGRNDTVCKHCVASLIARLNRIQVDVKIVDWSENGSDLDNAERVLRFGGSLIKLVSNQGKGQVWLVGARREEKPQNSLQEASQDNLPNTSKMTLEERNSLMRHPEDDYID